MKRFLALLFVACGIVLIPGPAFACSCAAGSVRDYLEWSDVVVDATVVDVREATGRRDSAYTLDVHTVLAGDADAEVVMQSVGGEGMCGVAGFARGDRAVFFLNRDDGELTSGLCNGNGMVKAERVAAVTGQEVTPEVVAEPTSTRIDDDLEAETAYPFGTWLAAGLVIAAILGLGIFVGRRGA